MNKVDSILNKLLPLVSIAAIVLLWIVAGALVDSEYILPTVGQTLTALLNLFKSSEFYKALSFTLLRSLIAFIISFALGFLLAFCKNRLPIVGKLIDPVISVIRALPTIAIILLLLFWTNSKVAPIIVTMLVVLPTSYTHLCSAFAGINKGAVEAGKVDGANGKQLFVFIEFPQIAPPFYKAMGSGISLNFKLMVAAEVLAQTANSIGYMLNTSKIYFEIAEMMALVLVSVAIGVLIETIFNKIAEYSSDWM